MRLKVLHAIDTKSVLMPEFLLPPNHPGFALLIDQSSLRDPHPKRVSLSSQDQDSEAGERARCLTARDTHHVMPDLVLVDISLSPMGPCLGEPGLAVAPTPLHQAAVRGNFCSSTALPVSSLWANFNHRVTAVRVKNLTLL